ncbi:YktB family protein [Metabacillus iocasae]|uniref:UPF0637 protein JOC83_002219 n=1 Tax=Priestia iocasae TaxID=2291674 RepID=A0ABS2QWK3_9BACI|nr:DUF1054 domain-containing protein [Metabacillus iocasae]MBM7703372.1 uncharacterized protein YktB (UPF0637 family) [Metabacillus iocasae]
MTFSGFHQEDFNVFHIEGLDARMEAIKSQIQPKFEELGHYFAPTLSALCGDEMHVHIAKHARRTVNPPNDTWVAFANSKRGYKKLPHFQIGLWESHVFIWFAVIYESPIKETFGSLLQQEIKHIQQLVPSHFVWSADHTKPDVRKMRDLQTDDLLQLFNRLQTIKKAEILCGVNIPKEQAATMTSEEWINTIDETFQTLKPLYELAKQG